MRVVGSDGKIKETVDFPTGAIVILYSSTIPDGWQLCDGSNNSPNLIDYMVQGYESVGSAAFSGTTSPTAALVHSGGAAANHSNHVVTQPGNHSNHVVTQSSNHSAHAVTATSAHANHALNATHTHDAHTTATRTAAGLNSDTVSPGTHNAPMASAHTHDAHSAHTGETVDAHSAHSGAALDAHSAHSGAALDAHSAHVVTQASNHPILKFYKLAYIWKL